MEPKKTKDEERISEALTRVSYSIKITKTEVKTRILGHEWVKGGSKPNTEEYGYNPLIESPTEVTTEILSQTVEEIDLTAVIKAVNKM